METDQLLTDMANWATRRTGFTPEQAERVKDILKANASRLDVFLSVMSIHKARMLQHFTRAADLIDRRLFDERLLSRLTPDQLIQLRDSVHRNMDNSLAFVKGMVDRAPPQFVQEVERQLQTLTQSVQALRDADPARREDLRALLKNLAKQVGNTNGSSNGNSPRSDSEGVE